MQYGCFFKVQYQQKHFFIISRLFFSSLKIQRIDCVFEKSGGGAEDKKKLMQKSNSFSL